MSENQTNASPETQAAEAPAVKLTRREKLVAQYNKLFAQRAKIDADLGELVAEVNSLDALAAIAEGSAVIVTVGKNGDTRDEAGVVLAVKEDEDGAKQYKVQFGTGFNTDIVVVKGGKLKLPQAAPVSEEAPADQAAQ